MIKMWINFVLSIVILSFNCTYSIELNCTEEFRKLSTPGINSCTVGETFVILKEYEKVKSINGITIDSQILGFAAENKKIYFIPQDISTFLPEINNFMIKNSSLKEVTSKNLKEFPNLVYLDLSFNHIKVLEKDVFQQNKKLNEINLSNNLIFAIQERTFEKFGTSGINLNVLNLSGNECQFSSATNRTDVIKVIGSLKEICWNESSKLKFEIYKNQRKFEQIEDKILKQGEDLRNSVSDYSELKDKVLGLKTDLQATNGSLTNDFKNLNETFNERIKRNAEKIEEIKGNQTELIYITQETSKNHTVMLNNISDNIITLKYEIANLKIRLDNMKTDVNENSSKFRDSLTENIQKEIKIQMTSNNLKIATFPAKNESRQLFSTTSEYLNTILLIIIIIIQSITICCKSCCKSKPKKLISKFQTAPPSLEPVYYTTATQIIDDYPKTIQRRKHYESYDDIQSYDFISTDDKPNGSKEVITSVQAEVEHQAYSNEIYGIVSACKEDLYSEVISPNKNVEKKDLEDENALYAVVNKQGD